MNNNVNIGYNFVGKDLKDIIDSIKEIPRKLKEYLDKLKDNTYSTLNVEYHQSMMEFMYPYMVEDMFIRSNNIISFLQEYGLTNEWHVFLEINRMMKIIIKDTLYENNEDELKFLYDVLKDFFNLLDFIFQKFEFSKELNNFNNEDKEYLKEYNSFKAKFYNYRYHFYTEFVELDEKSIPVVEAISNAINL
ncbi:MAG: hypothetical protein LBR24_01375 [Methanobrevibacter sp.]|jgi:hypothetical protein|nr:hypothetical protein [Methanobrevibacter sp.]